MGELHRVQLSEDPFRQFEIWFEEGRPGSIEPDAVAVATADANGRPSVRMVLLKKFDSRGFVFATNYRSRKGQEIEENGQAAMLFYWPQLERQIRIVGTISRAEASVSDEIFLARPRSSRIASSISKQSEPISGREELEAVVRAAEEEFEGSEVPRPEHWGGYRLVPEEFEFWQGRQSRLHDRFVYLPDEGGWRVERLQP